MRATKLQGLTRPEPVAQPNGTAHASSASRVVRTPSTTRPKSGGTLYRETTFPAQKLAPFAAVEAQPIDVQMGPVHSVVWLQPELRPGLPASSSLRIERHYKVPAPDFLYFDVSPISHPITLERLWDPIAPAMQQQLPQSDLVPLGWDPRAASSSTASVQMAGRSGTAGGVSPNGKLKREQYWKGNDQ
jgi:hypothetical protein